MTHKTVSFRLLDAWVTLIITVTRWAPTESDVRVVVWLPEKGPPEIA